MSQSQSESKNAPPVEYAKKFDFYDKLKYCYAGMNAIRWTDGLVRYTVSFEPDNDTKLNADTNDCLLVVWDDESRSNPHVDDVCDPIIRFPWTDDSVLGEDGVCYMGRSRSRMIIRSSQCEELVAYWYKEGHSQEECKRMLDDEIKRALDMARGWIEDQWSYLEICLKAECGPAEVSRYLIGAESTSGADHFASIIYDLREEALMELRKKGSVAIDDARESIAKLQSFLDQL